MQSRDTSELNPQGLSDALNQVRRTARCWGRGAAAPCQAAGICCEKPLPDPARGADVTEADGPVLLGGVIRTKCRQCLQEALHRVLFDKLSDVLFSNWKIIRKRLPKQKGSLSPRKTIRIQPSLWSPPSPCFHAKRKLICTREVPVTETQISNFPCGRGGRRPLPLIVSRVVQWVSIEFLPAP